MFGHLQIKSAYSFQESTILIQSLIDNAKSKHIQALALTDDNNMYGAYEFYEACTKASIKPILGVNASIMFNDDLIHLLLYARDDVGYKDLVRIVSDINLNEKKAITLKALSNYRDHLYIVSHEYEDRLIEQEATSKEDLLTLLEATLYSSQRLGKPIITMSMGKLGRLSRMMGEYFGSCMTFATAKDASAPGQVPLDDLKKVLEVLHD